MDERESQLRRDSDVAYIEGRHDDARELAVRWATRKTVNEIADYAMMQTDPVRVQAIRDLLVWMATKEGR